MAKKIAKIDLTRVKEVDYEVEINGTIHTFQFTQFSAKKLSELGVTLEEQLQSLKENTICITEGINDDEKEEILNNLFDWIWENQPAGEWMAQMRKLVGNDNTKK